MQFNTGDAGPYGVEPPTTVHVVHVDPITDLDARMRSWLRVTEGQPGSDVLDRELTGLDNEWKTLNKRLQQVFMLLALAKRRAADW